MIISPSAVSATSSSRTPGVLVTMIRAAPPPGVDIVVADAEAGDDLEIGQPAHVGVVERRCARQSSRGADARPPFSEPELGIRLEPQAMQRQTRADQRRRSTPCLWRASEHRGISRARLLSFHFRAAAGHGTRRPMTSLDGAHQARRRPRVRRLMLKDFRSYASLDLSLGGRSRRPMRRERRRQDQSP